MADSTGFLLSRPTLLFGEPEPLAPVISDTDGFIVDPELFFSDETEPVPATRNRSQGFLLALEPAAGAAGDTAFLIRFDSEAVPPILGNTMNTEILYPVIPASEVNKAVFPLDNEGWTASQKAATVVPRTLSTVRYRVKTSYLATFLADLATGRNAVVRLPTPGYCPFGGESDDNYVRVISHGRPQREDRGLTCLVDVLFRFVAVFP